MASRSWSPTAVLSTLPFTNCNAASVFKPSVILILLMAPLPARAADPCASMPTPHLFVAAARPSVVPLSREEGGGELRCAPRPLGRRQDPRRGRQATHRHLQSRSTSPVRPLRSIHSNRLSHRRTAPTRLHRRLGRRARTGSAGALAGASREHLRHDQRVRRRRNRSGDGANRIVGPPDPCRDDRAVEGAGANPVAEAFPRKRVVAPVRLGGPNGQHDPGGDAPGRRRLVKALPDAVAKRFRGNALSCRLQLRIHTHDAGPPWSAGTLIRNAAGLLVARAARDGDELHVTPMTFCGLRSAPGSSACILFFFDWRLGLVILFSVAEEFLTFLWMALPLFSVRYELALAFGSALALGLVVSGTEKNGIWWLPSITSTAPPSPASARVRNPASSDDHPAGAAGDVAEGGAHVPGEPDAGNSVG